MLSHQPVLPLLPHRAQQCLLQDSATRDFAVTLCLSAQPCEREKRAVNGEGVNGAGLELHQVIALIWGLDQLKELASTHRAAVSSNPAREQRYKKVHQLKAQMHAIFQ